MVDGPFPPAGRVDETLPRFLREPAHPSVAVVQSDVLREGISQRQAEDGAVVPGPVLTEPVTTFADEEGAGGVAEREVGRPGLKVETRFGRFDPVREAGVAERAEISPGIEFPHHVARQSRGAGAEDRLAQRDGADDGQQTQHRSPDHPHVRRPVPAPVFRRSAGPSLFGRRGVRSSGIPDRTRRGRRRLAAPPG